MAETNRGSIVVVMEGGLIQAVCTIGQPEVDVFTIDYDAHEFADEDDPCTARLPQDGSEPALAWVNVLRGDSLEPLYQPIADKLAEVFQPGGDA